MSMALFAIIILVATLVSVVAYVKSMLSYGKGDFAKCLPWATVAFCGMSLMVVLRIALGVVQHTPSAFIMAILWGFLAFMSYLRVVVCRKELASKKVDPEADKK